MNKRELERKYSARLLGGGRAKGFLEAFADAAQNDNGTLSDYYGSWSDKKAEAFWACVKEMSANGGEDGRIISASQWAFTFGYVTEEGYLVVITKKHRYLVEVGADYMANYAWRFPCWAR